MPRRSEVWLVDLGMIHRRIADLSRLVVQRPDIVATIQPAFDDAYRQAPEAFRAALLAARDYLGFALAETWKRLSPGFFSYAKVADTLLGVEAAMSHGRYRPAMMESFDWRGIGRVASGPRLAPPGPDSHSQSVRTLVPDFGRRDRGAQGLRPRFSNCRCNMRQNFKGGSYG